jgi:hypothetical protein
MATPQFPQEVIPPTDYSAAYVDELIIQTETALDLMQVQLNLQRSVVAKLRSQVNPH